MGKRVNIPAPPIDVNQKSDTRGAVGGRLDVFVLVLSLERAGGAQATARANSPGPRVKKEPFWLSIGDRTGNRHR